MSNSNVHLVRPGSRAGDGAVPYHDSGWRRDAPIFVWTSAAPLEKSINSRLDGILAGRKDTPNGLRDKGYR